MQTTILFNDGSSLLVHSRNILRKKKMKFDFYPFYKLSLKKGFASFEKKNFPSNTVKNLLF